MPSLIVPRSGLPLDFGSKHGAAEAMIALTLTDDAIENMIKCIREDDGIQLSYGAESTISYGTNTLRFTTSQDSFTYDIYQNTVASSNSPNTPEISKGPRKNNNCKLAYMGSTAMFLTPKKPGNARARESVPMTKQVSRDSQPKTKNVPEGLDTALEQLKANLATENAKKAANTAQRASSQLPPAGAKRGQAARDRLGARNALGGGAAAKRAMGGRGMGSIPTSPALNASSPALAPTSVPASEQAAEKTKTIRAPIIHRLAVADATEDELLKYKPLSATKEEFRSAIDKVADLVSGKYMLKNRFYKELDVWSFDYENSKARQTAIDNAVRAFDKMRMSGSDPEWQLLYPVDERNRGQTLSKLQAKIALNGPQGPAKKPVVDSAHGSEDEEDDLLGGGSQKTAPRSNGLKTKAQKDREAQDKRLSGKATAKQKSTTSRAVSTPKEKAAPKASAAGGKKATGSSSAPKSSEFVNDSDEEDDYVPEPSKKPSPMVSPKKESALAPRPTQKRKSDNDDIGGSPPKKGRPAATSSSSSSQSAKSTTEKEKVKEKPKPSHPLSRSTTTVASAQRSINNARANMTSPKKSSPLASSPPVSASDLEESDKSTSVSPAAPTKRKNVGGDRDDGRDAKRRKGFTSEAQADHDRFNVLYDKYETLWHELNKKSHRDEREMERLLDMDRRVKALKQKIFEDDARAQGRA